MRREFAASIEKIGVCDERIIFLTGDLGFMALEGVRDKLGSRFINVGVAEQNMIGIAAGLARQGFIPIVYSIAPFIVYRCLEQTRNNISWLNLPVIIVGNGGGYGYGIMGATHHAIEDYGTLGSLGIKAYVPMLNRDLEKAVNMIIKSNKPAYLRMGYGLLEDNIPEYDDWRRLSIGDKVTIASIGPVGINAYSAAKEFPGQIDHWVSGGFPVDTIPDELIESVKNTGNLICVEEHVRTGGFGEQLAARLIESGCNGFNFKCLAAKGYPDDTFGSQAYHQKLSELDKESIYKYIRELIG